MSDRTGNPVNLGVHPRRRDQLPDWSTAGDRSEDQQMAGQLLALIRVLPSQCALQLSAGVGCGGGGSREGQVQEWDLGVGVWRGCRGGASSPLPSLSRLQVLSCCGLKICFPHIHTLTSAPDDGMKKWSLWRS